MLEIKGASDTITSIYPLSKEKEWERKKKAGSQKVNFFTQETSFLSNSGEIISFLIPNKLIFIGYFPRA